MSELERIFAEGHSLEAWHGNNLKRALAGVGAAAACHRPGPQRHNIAEITLHHAFYVHAVRGRIAGSPPGPFPTGTEEWAAVPGAEGLDWPRIQALLEEQQQGLACWLADLAAGRAQAALPPEAVLNQVLGLTCHDAYHAGQVGLLKTLGTESAAAPWKPPL